MKKIKVFESGNYPQGNFNKERVKSIFGNVKDKIVAIFSHTSKWKDANKEPLNIGNFFNFELKETDDKIEVLANVEFNELGEKYYQDGILKGVSVEITDKDILSKVAILPIGINPAVAGAEFEEMTILEFEEVEELTREEVIKTLTLEELKTVNIDGYNIEINAKEEPTIKTEAEIREEVKREFERKAEIKKEVAEFMSENSKKITPAMAKVITDETLEVIFSQADNLEFEDKVLNAKEFIKDFFKTIPDLIKTEKETLDFEVEKKTVTLDDVMEKAKEETKKRYKEMM